MAGFKRFFSISSVEQTKIDVKDLKIGMFVSALDRPWQETNFLFQGFEIKSQKDIEKLQQYCSYVFIDTHKTENSAINDSQSNTARKSGLTGMFFSKKTNPKNSEPVEHSKTPDWQSDFKENAQRAFEVHKELDAVVKGFMREISSGGGINVDLAKETIAACVDNIMHTPDAMMLMTQLKNRDEYTAQHSMNVALFSILLGKQLNLSIPDLNTLGLCGMMHDMGKMRVPLEVLNKPGRFTPEEAEIMNSHTTEGWRILKSTQGIEYNAMEVAYSHHERLDGKGYPRGLKAEQISPYARMVAIVDMYDAITSDRVYQKGRTHLEAIDIMTKNADIHLDAGLTAKFIEALGIYPPGHLIEMTNGEIAMVVETNAQHKLKPKVMFVLNENKLPRSTDLIDLSKMSLDKSGQLYKIKKLIRPDECALDISAFYQQFRQDHQRTDRRITHSRQFG